ncbi:MAG: serine hydrolase domain-containing protein [Steroidobacteraceae bacterium]
MADSGIDRQRLELLPQVIKADIAAGLYHGLVLKVAHHGEVVADLCIGSADAEQTKPLQPDSVFSIFSVTKAFTNLLVMQAIEQGRFALTTPISDLIPEFKGHGREKILMWHLLSHQAGFPILFEVKPGWYIDNFDEVSALTVAEVKPVDAPCAKVSYSPLVNHVLMATALLRTDPKKRRYRQIVQQDILDPLSMKDTSVGLRADLKARKVVPDFRNNYPIGHKSHNVEGPNGAFEDEKAEMPWVGIASTVPDMHRFTDMFRRAIRREAGTKLISHALLDAATQDRTGDKENELYAARGRAEGLPPVPAYIGLGFTVRGEQLIHHMFGTLASPRTFGNDGAGTTLFWIAPVRDLTFTCLSAGVMDHNANTRRFQKLADILFAAVE